MVKRIFEWRPIGKRSRGCPKNTWQDEVLKDIRVLVVKNWTMVMIDRMARHDMVEEEEEEEEKKKKKKRRRTRRK